MRYLMWPVLAAVVLLTACARYVPVSARSITTPADTTLPSPSPHAVILRSYSVEKGDTTESIAAKFGLTVEGLVARNPGMEVNPEEVHPGELLAIDPGASYTIVTRLPPWPHLDPTPQPSSTAGR